MKAVTISSLRRDHGGGNNEVPFLHDKFHVLAAYYSLFGESGGFTRAAASRKKETVLTSMFVKQMKHILE